MEGFVDALESGLGHRLPEPDRTWTIELNDPAALEAAWQSAHVEGPISKDLSAWQLPCLISAGEANEMHDDAKQAAEEIPDARFVSIPGLSHMTVFYEADECCSRTSSSSSVRFRLHDPNRFVILNRMVQYSTTVDRAFEALADPTRRAVLERLGSASATISELAEPFGMSLTGMKKHVRLLEEAELVTTEKIGRVRRCMLVPYAFEGISTWLARLDRFAQVVERTKGAR